MAARFSAELLRRLRNEVPLPRLLTELRWPHKRRDGQLVFVCPNCGESRSDLNPRENLLRCFHCATNFNPIDFTMLARDCDFIDAVNYLCPMLAHASPGTR
jgi:predicted RNA-binding Zn-ribbon protein involved in translation (DUF1610 family)